jgi:DNA polymerase I
MMATSVRFADRVILIDGSGFIFRAYHTRGDLRRPSDDMPVGAIQGFCEMFGTLLRRRDVICEPTHLAIVFDRSRKTFRTGIDSDYKANRQALPEDLKVQLPFIRQAVEAFSVAQADQEGFEADDLIATYARQAVEAGADVTIVSPDKDMMGLLRPEISLFDPMGEGHFVTEADVLAKFFCAPDRVWDVQALAGDAADNVPGVPGIGVKTGGELISQFGDLETLLANAHSIKQPARRERIMRHADRARLSRRLVELRSDVPVEVPLEAFAVRPRDHGRLMAFVDLMEFQQLGRIVGPGYERAAA